MIWRGEIVGPWVDADGDESRHSQLGDDYDVSLSDATGQPTENIIPNPNLKIDFFKCEETVLDAIVLDNTYDILWQEEDINATA